MIKPTVVFVLLFFLSFAGKAQTVDDLDKKFGFRDKIFGSSVEKLTKPKKIRIENGLDIYEDQADDLSLLGFKLEKIEYHYYKDKLVEINIEWDKQIIKEEDGETQFMSVQIGRLYGKPSEEKTSKRQIAGTLFATAECVWTGSRVRMYCRGFNMFSNEPTKSLGKIHITDLAGEKIVKADRKTEAKKKIEKKKDGF